mmetsp:Transcript_4649/g.11938  ORF Transcript_4649/g.11938 Transcript_4649/m.11938 type:complete len:204 (-) Transcript_4649:233-844(-)
MTYPSAATPSNIATHHSHGVAPISPDFGATDVRTASKGIMTTYRHTHSLTNIRQRMSCAITNRPRALFPVQSIAPGSMRHTASLTREEASTYLSLGVHVPLSLVVMRCNTPTSALVRASTFSSKSSCFIPASFRQRETSVSYTLSSCSVSRSWRMRLVSVRLLLYPRLGVGAKRVSDIRASLGSSMTMRRVMVRRPPSKPPGA